MKHVAILFLAILISTVSCPADEPEVLRLDQGMSVPSSPSLDTRLSNSFFEIVVPKGWIYHWALNPRPRDCDAIAFLQILKGSGPNDPTRSTIFLSVYREGCLPQGLAELRKNAQLEFGTAEPPHFFAGLLRANKGETADQYRARQAHFVVQTREHENTVFRHIASNYERACLAWSDYEELGLGGEVWEAVHQRVENVAELSDSFSGNVGALLSQTRTLEIWTATPKAAPRTLKAGMDIYDPLKLIHRPELLSVLNTLRIKRPSLLTQQ